MCRGDSVAVKIEATNSTEGSRLFGRHFVETDELCSKISRESINALKAHFRDEMTQPLWQLVIKLKKVFKID
jgi:translation initiation factor 5B